MSRQCSVCSHESSFEINEALILDKRSNRRVAAQYDLSEQAIRRHREHIPQLLVKASQGMEVAEADALLEELRALYIEAREVLARGKAQEDDRLVLAAIETAARRLETLLEVAGELQRAPRFELHLHPDWARIETAIVSTLKDFPAARRAVVGALKELPSGSS